MAVGQNHVDLLLKLVRGNGCKRDDATAGRVLLPNGFTKAGVFEIEKLLDRPG
ncbi:MAG: hypothetical protein L3J36_03215 [Rhodobacteraceae bacterium]|nr:hypothetical protein [Paracoccaceae bacterium]